MHSSITTATTGTIKTPYGKSLISGAIDCDGGDPWIMRLGDFYYYSKIEQGQVILRRSHNITDIAAGESSVIFDDQQSINVFWAPEIHYLDGGWYVYFAAQPQGSDIHHTYVLATKSPDPFKGSWHLSALDGMDDKFAIDGTVADVSGKRYFIWSGWEGYTNVQQNLYIARMVSPTCIADEKILISQPEYPWECATHPTINEGPAVLIHGSTVNLTYSASGSWTDNYCIGLLTAQCNADLTDPTAWSKRDTPILRSGCGIYGPGHNSFVVSPDGSQVEMIYHSARWHDGGFNRSVRFFPVNFDRKGHILPMDSIPPNQLIEQPSGEPHRLRHFSDDIFANHSAGLSIVPDSESLTGHAIYGLERPRQNASWQVQVPEDGQWSIFIWYRNASAKNEHTGNKLLIDIDGITKPPISTVFSSCYQPIVVRETLKSGIHMLSIHTDSTGNPIFLDYIELMPQQSMQ